MGGNRRERQPRVHWHGHAVASGFQSLGRLFDRWLVSGAVLMVAFLVLDIALTLRNTRQLQIHSRAVSHTHEVIAGLERLLSVTMTAEIAQRDYLLTGDPRDLRPYEAATAGAREKLDELRRLTSGSPRQTARMVALREAVLRRLAEAERTIELRRDAGFVPEMQPALVDRGRKALDALRAAVHETVEDERGLVAERARQATRAYRVALFTSVTCGVAALAAVGAFLRLLKRHLRSRATAAGLLRAQRELLHTTLASIGDAVVTTDRAVRVTFLNRVAETLTGWSSDGAIGKPIGEVLRVVDERTRESVESPARAALEGKPAAGPSTPVMVVSRNGAERPVDETAAPIRDDHGRIVGCVLVVHDVSTHRAAEKARLESEAALRDADRRKDEFLATLSHELRNPLAAIQNALALLRVRSGEGATAPRELMERQLGQLVRLVDDLLDVARINRGKLELRLQRLDLASVLYNAIDTCHPIAAAMHHEITLVLPSAPAYVLADPVRLAQVFSNLINNACKFTPEGGHIAVVAERQGSDIVVNVRDDGIGIPREELDHVFEMFAQVDRSLERTRGGLGIGLTLVERLVDLHGGSVEARSDGPGEGSAFVVRLPLAAGALEAAGMLEGGNAGGDSSEAELGRAPRRAVLVVDDNVDSAESLAALLELAGNDVRVAHDGLQALSVASEQHPDLVLLDIGLPRLNGYEVARRMRAAPWARNGVVIVALTGWGQEDDRRRSREAGFDHHFVKPVNHRALMALLASASHRSAAER